MRARRHFAERHADPRYLHRQEVTIIKGEVELQAETRDVSASGLYVALKRRELEIGDLVTLRVRVHERKEPIELSAKVMRDRADNLGRRMGIGFLIDLADPMAAVWAKHVRAVAKTNRRRSY